ncbi:MAG TPA: AmmeMemoRadiSam system protein B [Gammaproteobacteria bacterium]|nr:AmmeMemoRadiSam system protein B [Gammaproteobacteria bacterium]
MHQIRPPAVAGAFYNGQRQQLLSDVNTLLQLAEPRTTHHTPPKALIVPHAGYIYSGSTAATAYAQLQNWSHIIKRVILLGPVHYVPVRGLALPGADVFATPLGEINIDQEAIQAIAHLPQVVLSPQAHEREHSLEVQLPFLQAVLDDFSLLPLAVGDATPSEIAEVLDILWDGPETLIVISSDLSHFLPYENARQVDSQTVKTILAMQSSLSHEQACGGTPINGFLLAARRHHLKPELLNLCNSGDTSGDKSRVVGYAAFAFYEEDDNETRS